MLELRDLGRLPYREAWALQEHLRATRLLGRGKNTVLLVEHPPVFTLGHRDCDEDILSPREVIAAEGIEIVKSNRGGRITYHGPGQLVGYFICQIADCGMAVGDFVTAIEELCLRVLADFGVRGQRDADHPGIWLGRDKIVAIGLHFSHGVSQHGFALNVNPDLTHYRHILPCGIRDRGVTSLAHMLKTAPPMAAVKERVAAQLAEFSLKRPIRPRKK